MVTSSTHQLALSGWLKENDPISYNSSLKLQKFLLLYDLMEKNDGVEIDVSHLRGYIRGPVYSNVWGDYTKERVSFDAKAEQAYSSASASIDREKAMRCDFVVKTMTEEELSQMTHALNLWKNKEKEIMSRKGQVSLDIKDYDSHDAEYIYTLTHTYSMEDITERKLIEMNGVYFLFNKEDYDKLNEIQYDTLWQLTQSDRESLFNPVFAGIDDDGTVLIDG